MQSSEENESHPLKYVRDNDEVKCKLEQTRLDIETRAAEKSSLEQNETDDNEQETTSGETPANNNADTSPETEHQKTVAPKTSNPAIPAKLSTLLTQLTQSAALENLTQNALHAPAWSTRLNQTQNGHRQVGFHVTLTFRYPEQQHRNLHTLPTSRQPLISP